MSKDRLVGLVTEDDFVDAAQKLIEEQTGDRPARDPA